MTILSTWPAFVTLVSHKLSMLQFICSVFLYGEIRFVPNEMKLLNRPKGMNKLNILGVTITTLYMIFVGWIVYPKFDISSLQTLPLNELGDFLAGVFGPLALAWLIIGYFQQQKELRLNTEALTIQVD